MKSAFVAFMLCSACALHSQVFQAGDVILSAGNGASIFHQHLSDSAGYYEHDTVAGLNLCFRAEYGISTHFGIAASYSVSGLISETFLLDAQCSMMELGIGLNYHLPIANDWIDVQGEIGTGFGRFYYILHNTLTPTSKHQSLAVYAGFHPRIYFTKKHHLGGYPYYRYSMQFGSGYSRDATSPSHNYDVQTFGHTFGMGFFYRFGTITNNPG